MLTSLDWLVIAFMGLAAMTLLSLCLMFLLKNKVAKRVCFYAVLVLALYMAYIGLRIGFAAEFLSMIAIGFLGILASVGAFVLERVSKGNEKLFLISRIIAAAALVVGLFSALVI